MNRPCRLALTPAILAAICCAGCIVEETGRPRRPTRPPQPQPEWAVPDSLLVVAPLPDDLNGNGAPDTFMVTAYLFDSRNPPSIRVPGHFVFSLAGPGGKPLREWTFSQEETEKALRGSAAGPSYHFSISLLDAGTDDLPRQQADLNVTFLPASGAPVRARGPTTFRIGRSTP